LIIIGIIIALKPRTRPRLNIFEPITFQTERAQLPCIAAIPDKNNSGAEVHIATIVSHISRLDTLKYLAILILEVIK